MRTRVPAPIPTSSRSSLRKALTVGLTKARQRISVGGSVRVNDCKWKCLILVPVLAARPRRTGCHETSTLADPMRYSCRATDRVDHSNRFYRSRVHTKSASHLASCGTVSGGSLSVPGKPPVFVLVQAPRRHHAKGSPNQITRSERGDQHSAGGYAGSPLIWSVMHTIRIVRQT